MNRTIDLSLLLALLFLAGCSEKKQKTYGEAKNDTVLPTLMDVSANDTAEVLKMVDSFTASLKADHVDGAVDMLYQLDNDSILPLPADMVKKHRTVLSNIKGLDYRIEHLIFFKETDSEVKVVAKLFDKKPGDTRPNEIGVILKPVRRNGIWYLTLADSNANASGIRH